MITFQNKPVTLQGTFLTVGQVMPEFTVYQNDLSALNLSDIKGNKIILSVPSIDTGVCSMEVAKFMNLVKELKNVTCLSVSMDLPFALDRWCQAQGNENVITTSDYKDHSFAKASATYVEELGLLTRAVFVLDENNVIKHVEYVKEITNEPDYEKVLKRL